MCFFIAAVYLIGVLLLFLCNFPLLNILLCFTDILVDLANFILLDFILLFLLQSKEQVLHYYY